MVSNHARNIKDLSIALEALTRVPDADQYRYNVGKLLDVELEYMRREQHPPITTQPNRTEPHADIPF